MWARVGDAPSLPAVAYTSDYSRPGFERMGFVPTIRGLGESAGDRWVDHEVIDVREEMARLRQPPGRYTAEELFALASGGEV